MNMERLNEWLETGIKIRELDAELKAAKEKLQSLEPDVMADLEEEGIDSVKVNGFTIYAQRNLWAGVADGVDRQVACDALKDAGLNDFVAENFNAQTLSSYFRELEKSAKAEGRIIMDQSQLLPETLKGKIKLTEKFGLRFRKS